MDIQVAAGNQQTKAGWNISIAMIIARLSNFVSRLWIKDYVHMTEISEVRLQNWYQWYVEISMALFEILGWEDRRTREIACDLIVRAPRTIANHHPLDIVSSIVAAELFGKSRENAIGTRNLVRDLISKFYKEPLGESDIDRGYEGKRTSDCYDWASVREMFLGRFSAFNEIRKEAEHNHSTVDCGEFLDALIVASKDINADLTVNLVKLRTSQSREK
jgi:hypothetical protein